MNQARLRRGIDGEYDLILADYHLRIRCLQALRLVRTRRTRRFILVTGTDPCREAIGYTNGATTTC